jgi:hypothetical protein
MKKQTINVPKEYVRDFTIWIGQYGELFLGIIQNQEATTHKAESKEGKEQGNIQYICVEKNYLRQYLNI